MPIRKNGKSFKNENKDKKQTKNFLYECGLAK
jgi:hypothetical protein